MTSNKTKLIILRGPAGSGKSSIAQLLQKSANNIALIEQDYYREVMLQHGQGSKEASQKMLYDNTLTALSHGFHVVLDGIFAIKLYGPTFEALFQEHAEENYIFYLDTSFEETLKRHNRRDKAEHFGEEEMKAWYQLSSPTGWDNEHIIPESATLEEAVRSIQEIIGLKND